MPPIPKLRQTQPNPSHFGATDSIPVPPSLGCQLSVTQIHNIGTTEIVGSASPRMGNLTVGHLIGATEFPISVSLRFKSCHLLVTSVPPRLTHRCHRVRHFVCNGWIFGDAYIYPFTTTYSKEKHSELFHTCPIQFSEREPLPLC